MSTAAYKALIAALADAFGEDAYVAPQDLRPISDDELAVLLNHEPDLAIDACRPAEYADILNGVNYTNDEERNSALGMSLRHSLTKEARDFLAEDVNTELWRRTEPKSDSEITEHAMNELGITPGMFA